ncbi:MAG: HAD family hydrolase [Candidatus Woesearchaeota archaeon]
MIKGVAFDAGGVLLVTGETSLKTENLFKKYFPEIRYERYMKNFRRFKNKAQKIKGYSFKTAVEECLKSLGIKDKKRIRAFSNRIIRIKPKIIRGCRELFEFIKRKKLKIIILSDTHNTSSSARKFFKLKNKKISEMIDFIITSKDVGCKKPCSKILRYACKKSGLKREEILFISDSMEEISGARIFGFKTILFSNKNISNALYLKPIIEKYLHS